MNDEDFIEDSYLDASAENGSHTLSPQPSSYFAIDSDNGSDEGNLTFYSNLTELFSKGGKW